ncbi:RNA polymerase Rpb1, domain 2 [Teladorsagia circumcincta]|uniref:DNA-directed RNA polymerase n=1 Tax=Teladorsagia circumcincta TaxID=45464 RepID=A0A2G9TSL5_TELCI|nr:RNA polymerase Rpb1, domain 2 [Teladorsagia circumcincta]
MVPPTKFRPIRLFKGERYENPQSVNLRRAVALVLNGEKSPKLMELITNRTQGKTMNARMHNAYLQLQQRVNAIYDEELDKHDQNRIPGIKQILEKKQGLFRMNMMGKRVNFACRSVITPDPYLDIDEIGIPEIFAKKLTFTEPVNLFNKKHMRKLVVNGPAVHPGARVITGQRALRMNYAPCKAYNADFDGDEMNGHLVQSHIAQCEVAELEHTQRIEIPPPAMLKPRQMWSGKQGLIDTAVKTSRSGYLQRCLIKHLEGLRIHYDGTVRDHDGSVVQFRYGEDGLDVMKSTYISPKTFPFLKDNLDAVTHCSKPEEARDYDYNVEAAEKQYHQIGVDKERIVGMWAEMDRTEREVYEKRAPRKCPHAVDEVGMRSLAEPGENVGLLAAQSIGEPSTQMTLNTFHFAGRGEMNVTLGIPRLREILMTASDNIATPNAKVSERTFCEVIILTSFLAIKESLAVADHSFFNIFSVIRFFVVILIAIMI